MTTIAVLDSDEAVVASIARRLAPAFAVVGCTEAAAALELVESGRAQVLVTDILSAGIDGLSLIVEARRRVPRLPVVVVSTYGDPASPDGRRLIFRFIVPGSSWPSADERRELVARLSPIAPKVREEWNHVAPAPVGTS